MIHQKRIFLDLSTDREQSVTDCKLRVWIWNNDVGKFVMYSGVGLC